MKCCEAMQTLCSWTYKNGSAQQPNPQRKHQTKLHQSQASNTTKGFNMFQHYGLLRFPSVRTYSHMFAHVRTAPHNRPEVGPKWSHRTCRDCHSTLFHAERDPTHQQWQCWNPEGRHMQEFCATRWTIYITIILKDLLENGHSQIMSNPSANPYNDPGHICMIMQFSTPQKTIVWGSMTGTPSSPTLQPSAPRSVFTPLHQQPFG